MTKKALSIKSSPKVKGDSIDSHFTDGVTQRFSKGETIIDGLDSPQGVFLIKKGFVKTYTITKSGQKNLMLIHAKDEFMPLAWVLDGVHTGELFYEAMSDVTVLKTSREKLRAAMDEDNWLSQEVLRQSVKIIKAYAQRIEALGLRTARERLIAELLNLTEAFGKKQGNEILIDAPITHQDIADSINMNRETASRALGLLFDEGLIKQVDHLFSVRAVDKLEDASG